MHFQSKTLPQYHNPTGGRKKKPEVMVPRHAPLMLRIHGVCRHPPHVAMAKLNDMAVPGQRFLIASPRDVTHYIDNTPEEGVPHVDAQHQGSMPRYHDLGLLLAASGRVVVLRQGFALEVHDCSYM
jgi:hypothetical protein